MRYSMIDGYKERRNFLPNILRDVVSNEAFTLYITIQQRSVHFKWNKNKNKKKRTQVQATRHIKIKVNDCSARRILRNVKTNNNKKKKKRTPKNSNITQFESWNKFFYVNLIFICHKCVFALKCSRGFRWFRGNALPLPVRRFYAQ